MYATVVITADTAPTISLGMAQQPQRKKRRVETLSPLQSTLGIEEREAVEEVRHDDWMPECGMEQHKLRCKGVLCDVTLRVKDINFPCHRIIVAGASDYFKKLFTGDFGDGAKQLYVVEDVTPEVFDMVLRFMYTGSCELDSSTVAETLVVADRFDVLPLRNLCGEYLARHLSVGNCMTVWSLAESTNMANLIETCKDLSCEQFNELAAMDRFVDIECDKLEELITRDNLMATEEELFTAIMRWAAEPLPPVPVSLSIKDEQQPQSSNTLARNTSTSLPSTLDPSRMEALDRMLPAIRFPQMSPQFLHEVVSNDKLFMSRPGASDLLLEAYKFMSLRHICKDISSPRTIKRHPDDRYMYAIGGEDDADTNFATVEFYDPLVNTWTLLENLMLNIPRHGCRAVTLNRKIYTLGGHHDAVYLNSVECLDLTDKRARCWVQVQPMLTPRHSCAAASLDGHLYVAGGETTGGSFVRSVERYDPSTNVWTNIANLSSERCNCTAAVMDGMLYVLGGEDNTQSALGTVERYNPATDIWEPLKNMSRCRAYSAAAAVRGYLFAMGGVLDSSESTATVERYDPRRNIWTAVASMNTVRSGAAVTVLDDNIYVLGGYDGSACLKTVERYIFDEDRWEICAPMNQVRNLCGVAAGI